MPQNKQQIENLSLTKLLGQLRPTQLWGIVVVLFGVVSGAFGLGFKASDYFRSIDLKQSQVTIKALQIERTDLETRLQTAESETDFSPTMSATSRLITWLTNNHWQPQHRTLYSHGDLAVQRLGPCCSGI
jgi:hypothetical protein